MPLPLLVMVTFAVGALAAACAETELRISPRPAVLTQGFFAHALFDLFVVLPIAIYFYAFHGDWFVLYAVNTARVPSALALLGLLLFTGVGALGFAAGASLVRAQQTFGAVAAALGAVGLGAALVYAARARVGNVGSFAQFHGAFGLRPFLDTELFEGALVMAPLFAAGAAFLCVRVYVSGRR